MVFGLVIYQKLKNLPVHSSMLEISELIYETCKTYLQTQGRFLMILEVFIGAAIIFYFGFLRQLEFIRVLIILVFSIIGILGSYSLPGSAFELIRSRTRARLSPA
jgi:K(+)-stimulated pyrophosphate-energized sodium pump